MSLVPQHNRLFVESWSNVLSRPLKTRALSLCRQVGRYTPHATKSRRPDATISTAVLDPRLLFLGAVNKGFSPPNNHCLEVSGMLAVVAVTP